MQELPDLSRLTHEQKDDLIRMLFPLIEQVRLLTACVEELEARLSKDSPNSSKPPSSDGLTKKTGFLRMSSGAKRGGQAGRIGKTLKRSNQVDVVIEYPLPEHCQECGATLNSADAQLDERRQVFDIPVAQFQVTEHRTQQLRCTCGQLHQSQFPEGVTEVVLFQRGTEGFVQRLLCKIEITEQSYQCREHVARLGTINIVDDIA